jgi:hypothetical protein
MLHSIYGKFIYFICANTEGELGRENLGTNMLHDLTICYILYFLPKFHTKHNFCFSSWLLIHDLLPVRNKIRQGREDPRTAP